MEAIREAAPTEFPHPRVRNLLLAMARRVWTWQERARERAHLESLDVHLLRDMGLTRADVAAEVGKPLWRR